MTDNDSALAEQVEEILWDLICRGGGDGETISATRDRILTALRTTGEARPDAQAVELLREARVSLLTGKDYAQDAASGALVYDDGARVSPTMASEDAERITELIALIDTFLGSQEPTP